MKNLLIVFIFIISCNVSFAQKAQMKKGIVTIDKKEFLKYDDEFNNIIVSTLKGKEILTLKEYSFQKPRKKNPNNPQDWRFGDTETISYYVVTFEDFVLEFETDLKLKDFYVALFKYNLLDENENVSEENAKKIASRISKDISGERPIIIIR